MGLSKGINHYKALGKGRVSIAGSFTTVNGAAPTITAGKGFTVARAAEGKWTVTLNETPNEIVAVTYGVAVKTAAVPSTFTEDFDARTTSSFTFELIRADGLTTATWAADDDAGSLVSFECICRNTSVDY